MAQGAYGCAEAQAEIDAFFQKQKDATKFRTNRHLLERVFGHMRDETDPTKPTTRCRDCWGRYRRLASKYDVD